MLELLTIKNKTHAVILINNSLTNVNKYINQYILSIIGKNIDLNKYRDLIWFDNTSEGVKKQDIENIIATFSYSAKEAFNKRFYVIKNIEHVNIQSLNSLLKFLEEPHDNIYAIFTCNNISNVLPTIKSRCQTYPIPKLYGIEKNYNPVELSVYNDYDMLIKDDTSGLFKELSEFVNKLLANNKIGQIKALSEQFKKMDYYDIAIVIKIVFYFKKKEVLLKMLDTLYLNPNKILLFNQILNSLN